MAKRGKPKDKITAIQKFYEVWLVFTTHRIYCMGSKKEVNAFVKKFKAMERGSK